MNRAALEHIIRAGAAVADDTHIVIVGSQAVLGQYPDAPAELLVSMEADVYPRHAPENAVVIDGAIGELSLFHQTFGYYAHGVAPDTAVLPADWRERLISVCNANTRGFTGECPEAHDLAVSKLAAGREKDLAYVRTLLTADIISAGVLQARVARVTTEDEPTRDQMRARLRRLTSIR